MSLTLLNDDTDVMEWFADTSVLKDVLHIASIERWTAQVRFDGDSFIVIVKGMPGDTPTDSFSIHRLGGRNTPEAAMTRRDIVIEQIDSLTIYDEDLFKEHFPFLVDWVERELDEADVTYV